MCVCVTPLAEKSISDEPGEYSRLPPPASRLGGGPGAKMTTRVSREPSINGQKRLQKKAGWVILLIHDASLWKINNN